MPLSPRVPELGALDVLLSVARLGSLGAAAREHGISQPAASSRIRYMERLLGLALIERSAAGSTLTPAGALVVDWARDVVDAAETLQAGADALRRQRGAELRVVASMTVAEYLVPGWLVQLRAEQTDLAVSLAVANSTVVAGRVLDGSAELGFVEGPSVPRGLRSRVVATDRLEVVVAPAHPWAGRRRPVTAAELAATPLIQREQGSGTRYTLARVLARHPTAAPLLELSSTTAVKAAVAAGAAPAVISSLAVAVDVAEHRLVAVPVDGIDLRRRLRGVWPAGQRLLGPARDLLAVAARTP